MKNTKNIPTESSMSPQELLKERQRLHDLIQKRSEVALKGVEKMSKHPLSLEQVRAQAKAMNERYPNEKTINKRAIQLYYQSKYGVDISPLPRIAKQPIYTAYLEHVHLSQEELIEIFKKYNISIPKNKVAVNESD